MTEVRPRRDHEKTFTKELSPKLDKAELGRQRGMCSWAQKASGSEVWIWIEEQTVSLTG